MKNDYFIWSNLIKRNCAFIPKLVNLGKLETFSRHAHANKQINLLYVIFSFFTKNLKIRKSWNRKKKFETAQIFISVFKMRKLKYRNKNETKRHSVTYKNHTVI